MVSLWLTICLFDRSSSFKHNLLWCIGLLYLTQIIMNFWSSLYTILPLKCSCALVGTIPDERILLQANIMDANFFSLYFFWKFISLYGHMCREVLAESCWWTQEKTPFYNASRQECSKWRSLETGDFLSVFPLDYDFIVYSLFFSSISTESAYWRRFTYCSLLQRTRVKNRLPFHWQWRALQLRVPWEFMLGSKLSQATGEYFLLQWFLEIDSFDFSWTQECQKLSSTSSLTWSNFYYFIKDI